MLDQSVEALAEADLPPSLYSGFCGVGWVVEHLTRDLADSEDDLSAEIDEALRERLADSGERPPYELVNGMAGFGTYLLERLHRPGAVELLGSILDQFASSVEEAPAGFTWRTLPEWIPPSQRERIRAGYYGLGVAHGVPGVIGFLASAQRAGVRDSRLQSLAEGAVSWVLAQKLPAGRVRLPLLSHSGAEPAADPDRLVLRRSGHRGRSALGGAQLPSPGVGS
jgi:hypothetical protein